MNEDNEILIVPEPTHSDDLIEEQHYDTEQFQSILRTRPQYIAAFSASLSALAAGAVLGWTSPILDELTTVGYNGFTVDDNQLGWIGSFVTLGAMTMCIPTGFICDLIGRKKTLILLVVPFICGWLLIYYAQNIIMLYFGRLLTGMAVGACCVASPLYTNEIAHKSIRGALGSYFQLMITVGIFLAYLLGKYLNPNKFTIVCAFFPIVFLMAFCYHPETPVFLLKRGLYEDAKKALIKLRGADYDVESELNEIELILKDNTHSAVSLTQTFQYLYVRKAILIAFVLFFCQQFSGINTVILYNSDIFQSAGVKFDVNTAGILVGAFQAIATFGSSLVVDKLGRRFLLITSSTVITFCISLLALYFSFKYRFKVDESVLVHIEFIPVGALCLFVVAFSLGLGPIPWMISSEIFAPEIKSICSSAAGTFNWFLAFLITKFYIQIAGAIGTDTVFYMFGIVSFLGIWFTYYQVPETKGKSISEIQDSLEN